MSDVSGISVSDVLGLSQPLTKLIEVCSSAIGMAYKPLHERRMTDAKVYEIKQIGEAIRENSDLAVNYQYRNVGIDATNTESLEQRTKNRLLYEEMKRQQNVEAVIANAYSELTGKETVSEKPVDEDWKNCFFNIAKDISSDDMRRIWGRILASEISTPGSFSMRTLDVIRSISRVEAEEFQRIAPAVMRTGNDLFVPSSEDLLDKYGIRYSSILALDECGLLVLNKSGILHKIQQSVIFTKNMIMILESRDESTKEIGHGAYLLTKAGRELFGILNVESNIDFFCDFAEELYQANKPRIKIRIHKVNTISDSNINYEDDPTKEFGVENCQDQ